MNVEGRKCREARSLPGGVHIFETRMIERLQEVGGRVTPGAVTEEFEKLKLSPF